MTSTAADFEGGDEEQQQHHLQQPPRQWQPWLIAHRALSGFSISLLLLIIVDSAVGRTVDWVTQAMCIAMALAVASQSMTLLVSSVVSFHLGLLGTLVHLDSSYDPLGILWLVSCVSLGLLSIAIAGAWLRFRGRRELAKGETWLPPLSVCGSQAPKAVRGCVCGLCCLLLLAVAGAIVLLAVTEDLCSVERYDASWVLPDVAISRGLLPAMEIGTRENINISAPIDLTGLWWIRWNHGDPYPFYSKYHVEELMSFAGAVSNVTEAPWFPLQLQVPNCIRGHWSYSNTLVGRAAMSIDSEKQAIEHRIFFDFRDSTHANLSLSSDKGSSAKWYFDRIDSDQWLRTIDRLDKENWFYTLQRIVFEDGTAHPEYWPAFLKHMEGTKLGVYTTDNQCMRECGSRPFGTCSHCERQCGR